MLVKLCDKKILLYGEMKTFRVRGHEILAVNLGGEIYCLEGRCSHAGAPLAEGVLDGEVLTCPWHYSQFRVADGSVLRGPAYKQLRTYRVEERENSLFVDL
jgi:nitrite reductase/ring-hydroxylating ferredoxin subunit